MVVRARDARQGAPTGTRTVTGPTARARLARALPVLVSLALFAVALEVLRLELRTVSWTDVVKDVFVTPPASLAAAVLLTALNYLALTGYDLLAFRYIDKRLPPRQVAAAAFLAYAISNNVGFAAISGASVRFRFYSRWGVTATELTRIVFSYSVTFWLGLLALGGLSFVAAPLPAASAWPGHELLRPLGAVLLAVVAAYLVLAFVRATPIQVGRLAFPAPGPAIAAGQLALSIADWTLAGAVLYVLLPAGAPPFLIFLGSFLVAILLGMASHVPGGLGVFEGLMVLLLRPWLEPPALLPSFVVYRIVYYLLPFVVALTALVADEARQRREHVVRAGAWLGQVARQLTPGALAAFTFLSGVVLLLSGATPASPGRLSLVHRLLPLGIIETSHFLGSVAGAGLLILSQGLARRLDAAYYFSSILIVIGMAASLLKGFDIEEAGLLMLVLLALRQARPAFDRRAAFFETRFSPAWIAAVLGTVGASIWLGLFAYKHVGYGDDLWWRFELFGEASRFLRASVGAAIVILLVGVARLTGHPPHDILPPDDEALADAARVIATQSSTSPHLVFLRDKGLIFNDQRSGFVMYGVQGSSWVSMGEPVGPEAARSDLIRHFLELANDYGGAPVFYEVGPASLHRFADFGMTFVKLGEEAHVDLNAFSLEGGHGARFRQAVRRLERDGATFRVIPAADVRQHLPALRGVSDDWLKHKAAAEKGFSLGFFDEDYVCRFPVGVIERLGSIQAFANLWPGQDRLELSMDLMRFTSDAPKSVMETLLVQLLLWGRQQGYQRFSLGMAPLSGFERSPAGSLWQRVGAFVYEHGEAVYGFQGLRAFKQKFNPEWEPRYLAYQGGLALPRILADVSALIAGGYRRIFMK